MTKKGSAKFVNSIRIGAGGLTRGPGYIKQSEYALSLTLPTYIDCYIYKSEYMLLFDDSVDFILSYDGTADIKY